VAEDQLTWCTIQAMIQSEVSYIYLIIRIFLGRYTRFISTNTIIKDRYPKFVS
jgi:hypothetical protein